MAQVININGLDLDSPLVRHTLRFCVGSYSPTAFQMPYPRKSKHDVSFAITACYFGIQEVGFKLLRDKNYDFLLSMGDHIYGDQAGTLRYHLYFLIMHHQS